MIDTEQRNDVIVIKINIPRIDVSTAVRFHESSAKAIEGQKKIVFDLSPVEFMDSTGIGALVGVAKRIGRDGKAAVTGLHPSVKVIFNLLRMDLVFSIQPDIEAAIRYLEQ